jgi:hypothetical protein
MQNVKFTYGSTSGVIGWDGARAEAAILLDGEPTGFATADAAHSFERSLGLVLSKAFSETVDGRDVDFETV